MLYDDLPLWILLLLYFAILRLYYSRFWYPIYLPYEKLSRMFLLEEIDKICLLYQQIFHNQEPLQLIDELYSGRFNQLQLMIFFSSTSFRFKEKPSKKLFNLHKNDGNYQSSPRSDYIRQIKRDKSCLLISTSLQLEASLV